MNLFPHQSVEYTIITHLQKQSWIIVDLIEELRKSRPRLTKQAVYQAIRKLRGAEIVVVTSKRISLSIVWIDRMHEFFMVAKYAYQGTSTAKDSLENFINLAEGDRIVYEFKNLTAADIFWGHAFTLLKGILRTDSPILIYNPHQWFILARQQTELRIIQQSETDGHPLLTYIPSKTPLDTYTKQFFKQPNSCYLNTERYFKPNTYINIFDDFIIEAVIDERLQKQVDHIFETEPIWNNSVQEKLAAIISLHGRNKITISRNTKKAEKYRSIFKKYFLIK